MKDTLQSDRFKITEITYEEVYPFWSEKLWPGREDIKPMSSMRLDRTIDMIVYELYSPTFFGAFIDNELVGVNSGHACSEHEYRSRGLYVDPEYRGLKLGKQLLIETVKQAADEGCSIIWSFPRKGSENVYYSVGFTDVTGWINGQNRYVKLEL